MERENTIWNISDIVRQASALAIVIPGTLDAQMNGEGLFEWGDRVWTMPELLLYTEQRDVLVYQTASSHEFFECQQIPKASLWSKVWSESAYSGQLVDHCWGSLSLSPLELTTVALHCLHNRKTTEYTPGDMSYVLMGFLRQRPKGVTTDSAFQAFARLSLSMIATCC